MIPEMIAASSLVPEMIALPEMIAAMEDEDPEELQCHVEGCVSSTSIRFAINCTRRLWDLIWGTCFLQHLDDLGAILAIKHVAVRSAVGSLSNGCLFDVIRIVAYLSWNLIEKGPALAHIQGQDVHARALP